VSDALEVAVALWGAILATALGILEILKHFRDKPRVVVSADLSFRATNKDTDSKGTMIETDHGTQEVLLAITAANHGKQALQITECLVE
jgi:hypothetical protein